LRDVKSKVSDSEMLYEKYKSDIDRLEKLSEDKQKQIDDQRELLKQVDDERDAMQSELDIKAEVILDLQGIITFLSRRIC
jgi:chromosome segregation ATPase